MTKTMDIDYAIIQTLSVHPDFVNQINSILNANCSSVTYSNFTAKYGARDKIKGCTPDDFIGYVIEQLINLYNAGISYYNSIRDPNRDEIFNKTYGEYYWRSKDLLDMVSKNNIDLLFYFKTNPDKLLEACSLVTKARFIKNEEIKIDGLDLRAYIDISSLIKYGINKTDTDQLKQRLYISLSGSDTTTIDDYVSEFQAEVNKKTPEERAQEKQIVEKLKVRKETLNRCLQDIINGSQLTQANNDYAYGNLFATQEKGTRARQEDAVLIMEHPKNSDFKIMIVSDGMGGVENGRYASSETVRRMQQWFISLDPAMYSFPNDLQKIFNEKIKEISKQIYYEKNSESEVMSTGATFVGAIITENETIVSSVGDSRAYTLTGKKLSLLTSDESQVWFKYKIDNRKPTEQELNDDRFDLFNSIITKYVGEEDLGIIQTYKIPNTSYDRLLLFSDGVTDLLTQERIAILSSGHDLSTITKYLVQEAITKDAIREMGEDEYHRAKINHAKDNATAAMYARR